MKKIVKFLEYILAASTLMLAAGCASPEAQFFPLSPNGQTQFGAPREANSVELFITKKPTYKYKELGMVTYETPANFADEPEIYQMLRTKAGQIGADAIIIMDSQSTIEQTPRMILDYYGYPIETETSRSYIKYRAMAIERIK